MTNPIAPLLASALTPLHPGSGRSMGAVDLEITRDPLGYPYVRGTMIKGALKTALAHKHDCLTKENDKTRKKIDCSKNKECEHICCLLGPDVGGDEETTPSRLSFVDLYPLFIPAPAYTLNESYTKFPGIVYLTTPTLINRARNLFLIQGQNYKQYLNTQDNILGHVYVQLEYVLSELATIADENMFEGILVGPYDGNSNGNKIYVKNTAINVVTKRIRDYKELRETMSKLNELYRHVHPLDATLILNDHEGRMLIESVLLRATRIRLDRLTKTVQKGALWTEEYLPWGTLLLGAVVESQFKGRYCNDQFDTTNPGNSGQDKFHIQRFIEKVNDSLGGIIIVGGNETVGAGILRLTLLYQDS